MPGIYLNVIKRLALTLNLINNNNNNNNYIYNCTTIQFNTTGRDCIIKSSRWLRKTKLLLMKSSHVAQYIRTTGLRRLGCQV